MNIEKFSTGAKITSPEPEMKQAALKYFSLTQPVREYFIYYSTPDADVLHIPSGFLNVNDPYIQSVRPKIEQKTAVEGTEISELNMTRSPRSKLQEDCIGKLVTSYSSKITVEVKPGVGKMEPYSRKIPTPTENGYTLMGDLQVGDFVFDRHGHETKILKIFEQGVSKVFEITFADGRTAKCGLNHLWTVYDLKQSRWHVLETKDIISTFEPYRYAIPVCDAVEYPGHKTYVDPWVLGCFLSAGDLNDEMLCLVSPSPEIPNIIAQKCDMFSTCENNRYYFYRNHDSKQVSTSEFFLDIYANCDEYKEFIQKVKIPNIYKINSVKVRSELLKGFFEMEHCKNPKFTSSNNFRDSNDLVNFTIPIESINSDILWMANSLGCVWSPNVSNNGAGYVLFNCSLSMLGKKDNYNSGNKIYETMVLGMIKIEQCEDENCRCIMVDNDEHLYLTEDFIVTHNTFIALYAISKLRKKTLIVCPTTNLKEQWIQELISLGFGKKMISTDIWHSADKPFTVTTISAIERHIKERWVSLRDVIEQANFGIKIIDEAHLHLRGLMKFDSLCNIKRNWYLSATLGRSSQDEDNVLKRAMLDADRFIGTTQYEEYQHQYVNLYFQDIYYYPSAKLCDATLKMGVKGLIRSTYYKMLLEYKQGIPFLSNIIIMIKRAKYISKEGKILILVPLHEIIDRLMRAMNNDPFFSGLSIGYVTGEVGKNDKPDMMEKDIILSTAQSMGTGVDVQKLAAVINYDQFASPIINEQIVGRLRDRGKETFFFDVCDHVKYAGSVERWGMKRRAVMPYFPGVKPNIHQLEPIHC